MENSKINSALESLRQLSAEEIRQRLSDLAAEEKTLRGLLRTHLLADSPRKKREATP
jgi:ribosomal protein L29